MNKLSKNISKVAAIITGLGMSFGACNLKAMDSSIKIDVKRISDEVDEQMKREDQSMYIGMGIGAASTVWLYCYFKYVVPSLVALMPRPTRENTDF